MRAGRSKGQSLYRSYTAFLNQLQMTAGAEKQGLPKSSRRWDNSRLGTREGGHWGHSRKHFSYRESSAQECVSPLSHQRQGLVGYKWEKMTAKSRQCLSASHVPDLCTLPISHCEHSHLELEQYSITEVIQFTRGHTTTTAPKELCLCKYMHANSLCTSLFPAPPHRFLNLFLVGES